jgi:phosphatidylinositol glycan class F
VSAPRKVVVYKDANLNRDREWQKWPVTIVTGAYIGYVVGKLIGGTLLKGKRVMFE